MVSYLESDLAYGASPVTPGGGELVVIDEIEDSPLLTPVTPNLTWAGVHANTQSMLRPGPVSSAHRSVTTMRRTATIRRGTRMIKLLSGRQLETPSPVKIRTTAVQSWGWERSRTTRGTQL